MFAPTRGFSGMPIHGTMQNVVGPILVAMATTFALGVESNHLLTCLFTFSFIHLFIESFIHSVFLSVTHLLTDSYHTVVSYCTFLRRQFKNTGAAAINH